MKILIVHAHPEPQSFCAAMCSTAADTLVHLGHQIEISDLYAMGFNPVASAADFPARKNPDYLTYALEQRHAADTETLPIDIRSEIDKVIACDLLILNFPIFWFSVPAILKGWIDRVFVSGIFYGGKRIYGRGGMKGKRALIAATLGGREHMFGRQAIHGELEGMLRPLLQGTLGYVGMQVLEPFFGYHIPYLPQEGRIVILEQWRDALRTLDRRASMPMPDLGRFDEQLRPVADDPCASAM